MTVEGHGMGGELTWNPAGVDEPSHDGALFGLEALSRDEAERLLARDSGRLVIWIGDRGAGKTTLNAELYEAQRRGRSEVRFAGSWTLLAFEQLAHRRRLPGAAASEDANAPDQPHREILHLALDAGEGPLDLLLTDFSGEAFRRLADNQIGAGEIPWLSRADKLVLLVDGARLRDAGTRATTLTRVRQFVERLQSAGLPRADARLALLVTKWDLVRDDPEAVVYWEPRESELIDELRAIDPDAPALRTAAPGGRSDGGFAELREWLLELRSGEQDIWTVPADVASLGPVSVEPADWASEPPRGRWRRWGRSR